jgi:hypothetical protein
MTSSWAKQEIPPTAVVIAPTAEAAANLAVAFDDVRVITLDELDALPAALTEGRAAALTGVPTRGGRLATVMAVLRTRGPADLQVMVDLRGPAVSDLRRDGAPAMAGFAPVDLVEVYGVPCLRLVPVADLDALPDLHEVLAAVLPMAGSDAEALRTALDRAERAEARIRDLAEQLTAAALPPAALPPADHGFALPADRRLPLAAAGLVAAGSGAALALSSRDRRGATLTLGVGALSLAQLWYARRVKGRLLHAVAEASGVGAAATAPMPSEELLTKVLAQQTEIHRNLAIVTAAVQDTAAAVAALADPARSVDVR